MTRAKLHPPITFHGLRKIAATRVLQGGVDLKTVMAIGAWTDPATLLRLYAAATNEAKRAAVAKLCSSTAPLRPSSHSSSHG